MLPVFNITKNGIRIRRRSARLQGLAPFPSHPQPPTPKQPTNNNPSKSFIQTLPPELLTEIFQLLERSTPNHPTLLILSRVSPLFYLVAKRLLLHHHTPLDPKTVALHLLAAESSARYLFPSGHYPCYKCARVLDGRAAVNFEDHMMYGTLALGGSCKKDRHCLDCGDDVPHRGPAMIGGLDRHVCSRCRGYVVYQGSFTGGVFYVPTWKGTQEAKRLEELGTRELLGQVG